MRRTLAAMLFLLGAPIAHADDGALRAACETLKLADFASVADAPTRVSESSYVEAKATDPAACLVRGYVAPQVGFEMKFPIADWNGKLVELGSGGFAGSTQTGSEKPWCDDLVRRGYACIHSDHGHTSGVTDQSIAMLDGVWAFNNPQAEIDYAFRGVHVVALAERAIAQKFYGAAQKKSYFLGCSGGGRQAILAAQRYPWDFDGIVAMEPAINMSSAFLSFLYTNRAVTDESGKPLFKTEDLQLLHDKAVARCDKQDGVEDGVIGDPQHCDFDPATVPGLSPAQIAAAKKVYTGAMTSSGKKLHVGHVMPGAERGSFGFASTRPLAQVMLNDYFRYVAFVPDAGPSWNPASFDFDRDFARLSTMEQLFAANNPDLRQFRDAGGKLIVVQGWDDSGTPFPLGTIDYYEQVEKVMGGEKATQEFARLFMVPGREHCGGGAGASAIDVVSAIENWTEKDQAPEMLIASHIDPVTDPLETVKGPANPANVKFTRPLYPYPLRAKYKGGDRNDYRSFKPAKK
ncbi:MAG TPA: tannase/feruloyl esterase family alpha/beta hydrolase [Nevskiaceae bacterium]|nr:tannase/feruloyl esterase family alpha/beta hydrolase [Nevskiaceae bacterium]